MIWTDEMAQMLIDLYKQDLTMSEIAAKMNEQFAGDLTRSAIAGRIHRMNLRSEVVKTPRGVRVKVDAPIPPMQSEVVSVNIASAKTPAKVVSVGVTIYQLSNDACHWPLGDINDHPPFVYCGKQAYENLPYCAEHCAIAYNAPQKTWY